MERTLKRVCTGVLLGAALLLAAGCATHSAQCKGGYPDGGGIQDMSPYSPNAGSHSPTAKANTEALARERRGPSLERIGGPASSNRRDPAGGGKQARFASGAHRPWRRGLGVTGRTLYMRGQTSPVFGRRYSGGRRATRRYA